jgi:hypothetical protein
MNVGRVIILFAYCFGVFIVPAAIILPLAFLFSPSAYVVEAEATAIKDGRFVDAAAVFGGAASTIEADVRAGFPGARAAASAGFADQSTVTLLSFASKGDGQSAIDAIVAGTPGPMVTWQGSVALSNSKRPIDGERKVNQFRHVPALLGHVE